MNKYVNLITYLFIMRLLYCCFDTSGRIWPSVWLQISTGRERCARTIKGHGPIQLVVRLKIEIIRELLLQMVSNKQVIDSVTITQPCPVHRRFVRLWEGWGNTGDKLQGDSLATCSHGPSGTEISQASWDTQCRWLLHFSLAFACAVGHSGKVARRDHDLITFSTPVKIVYIFLN